MAERPIDINLSTTNQGEKINEQDKVESRADRKARMAQVFDRGVVGDRLHVDLPEHLHGEWVPSDAVSVHRKESLGFRIDTEYAKNRKLHDKGDSASYVGDVVFMVCDRENKEILDEIRRDRYNAVHAPRGGKQKEERDFITQADKETAPTAESKAHQARKADITAAITAANNNKT